MKGINVRLGFYKKHGAIYHKEKEAEFEIDGANEDDIIEIDEDGEKRINRRIDLALLSLAGIEPEEMAGYDRVTVDLGEIER